MPAKEDSEPQLPVRASSRPRKPNNFGDQFICGPTGPTGRPIRPSTRSLDHRGGRKQGQKDIKPRKPRGKDRRSAHLVRSQAARWKTAKAAVERVPTSQEAKVPSPTRCSPEAGSHQAAQAGATISVPGQQAAQANSSAAAEHFASLRPLEQQAAQATGGIAAEFLASLQPFISHQAILARSAALQGALVAQLQSGLQVAMLAAIQAWEAQYGPLDGEGEKLGSAAVAAALQGST